MWYSGKMLPYVEGGTSYIGYAERDDFVTFGKVGEKIFNVPACEL